MALSKGPVETLVACLGQCSLELVGLGRAMMRMEVCARCKGRLVWDLTGPMARHAAGEARLKVGMPEEHNCTRTREKGRERTTNTKNKCILAN